MTINVFNPQLGPAGGPVNSNGGFVNMVPAAVSGDIALVNILIELRVISQLIVLNSLGLPIRDDLQKLRIDEANSPV